MNIKYLRADEIDIVLTDSTKWSNYFVVKSKNGEYRVVDKYNFAKLKHPAQKKN
jgi:hypothetical protein